MIVHGLRRTSASVAAENGADIERIMAIGGWNSPKTARGYVENSLHYKLNSERLLRGNNESKLLHIFCISCNLSRIYLELLSFKTFLLFCAVLHSEIPVPALAEESINVNISTDDIESRPT